jgi:hypothetical protein
MVKAKDRSGFERHFRRLAKRFAGDSETAVDRIYQAFEKSTP